ncbi:T9SS type A sorting domain-containing protein [Flavobacterium sp.]|uniref:T9SS type A sorting domain-containing protein n=1 Tax=Flavobacterium sp. TaxID=239 RepID=UPI002637BE7B|nr:T9SS type A sorting domain-containing protein [Flavobacterium sp.]MDD2986992.1 T9SS type A sorting domain-containing protein [Flavobacterium sp.]
MKKNLLFIFFLTLWCNVFSEKVFSQDILWEKSFGGKQADFLFDVIPTPDYGFILAGSSVSNKSGNKDQNSRGDMDYWVWKMNEKGEFEWQKSMGGNAQDKLRVVVLTNEGGFLLAGSSESEKGLDKKDKNKGGSDFWIIKLDAKGGELWQKTIGGSGQDELTCAMRTRDGGFIIGGTSDSEESADKTTPNYGGTDYWVLKLDKNGKIEWQQSFGGNYSDELRSITQTKDGGFLLGGSSNSLDNGTKSQKNRGQSDFWVIRIDEDGKELWQKVIGGNKDDQLYVVTTTNDGNYLLGGNSNSETSEDKLSKNESGTDFWVIKLNDEQTILWQETYNIGKMDVLTSLLENDDQTILLGGYTQGERIIRKSAPASKVGKSKSKAEEPENMKKGTSDYVAIKLNPKGEEIWRKEVGSKGEDILKKVIETRDGGYLMAGTSKGAISDDRNSSKGGNDFWVVKLKDKDKKVKDKVKVEAIPNPAIDFTNVIVGFEFTKGTATLVDLAGHILQQFPIKERTVPIDMQGLPMGIYVVNIKTDKGDAGVKILKQDRN